MKFTISLPHDDSKLWASTGDIAARNSALMIALSDRGFNTTAVSSNRYRTIVVIESRDVAFGATVAERVKAAVELAGGDVLRFDLYAVSPMLPVLWD
jgi:hypothetical protein